MGRESYLCTGGRGRDKMDEGKDMCSCVWKRWGGEGGEKAKGWVYRRVDVWGEESEWRACEWVCEREGERRRVERKVRDG